MIYFSSDLHLNHNQEFCYNKRGFETVEQMNSTIIQRQKEIVKETDDYYILGDVALGDIEEVKKLVSQLNGNIHLIRGNHDTDTKIQLYKELGWEVCDGKFLKYKKHTFFLTHYPVITGGKENKQGHLSQYVISLYGHTHQNTNFFNDIFNCYHVGVDSHECNPVSIEQVMEDIRKKYLE